MKEHFDCLLSSRTCLNYLHRLGFVLKRPKKHLLKANAEKRAVFVREYMDLCAEALATGAKIWFVDEAHFRADVELRTQWVQRGQPALVDSTSPRFGEKATYYSAVCLETGKVVAMPVEGNTNAETSVTFLQLLREKCSGPLIVIWDNGPAHHGDAMRAYLTTPDLKLRLVALPGYSPDFNPDEERPTEYMWKTREPQEHSPYPPRSSPGRTGGDRLSHLSASERSNLLGYYPAGRQSGLCSG